MIPRILHRTIREETPESARLWAIAQAVHGPDWQYRTYLCGSLERANLVRLGMLIEVGGVYIDGTDVECLRPFDPLLEHSAFAGYEDDTWVCDAVLGAVPHHPAIIEAYRITKERMREVGSAIDNRGCPISVAVLTEVATTVGPGTGQVTLMQPEAFYPYHWSEKKRAGEDFSVDPATFCVHHWARGWHV